MNWKAVVIGGLVGCGLIIGILWGIDHLSSNPEEEKIEIETYNNILDSLCPLQPLIEDCRKHSIDTGDVTVKGIPLIWFLNASRIYTPDWEFGMYLEEDGHIHSPDDYYGTIETEQITFFLVSAQPLDLVGYYSYGLSANPDRDTPAYRAKYDIYIFYWPEREAVGVHTIISDPPTHSEYTGAEHGFKVEEKWAVVGDIDDVQDWCKSLSHE